MVSDKNHGTVLNECVPEPELPGYPMRYHPRIVALRLQVDTLPVDPSYRCWLLRSIKRYADQIVERPVDAGWDDLEALQQVTLGDIMEANMERLPLRFEVMDSPLVVHIPHSSTWIPDEDRQSFLLADAELEREQILMIDHQTDLLFTTPAKQHTTVVFPVSRLLVDPERFLDDAAEPMSVQGMGVLYTHTAAGNLMRKPPTTIERARLVDTWYRPHHQRLTLTLDKLFQQHPTLLLVDGHSFPSQPLTCDLDQTTERPDICLGTDPFHTPPWLIDAARDFFCQAGYRVEVDRPYSGALVPMAHYLKTRNLLALMIEVNRRLYCDESTGRTHEGFETTRRVVTECLDYLARALTRVTTGR